MATQTLLTFDEFLDLPDQEGVFRELDEGMVIEMPWASFPHGTIQVNGAAVLKNCLRDTGAEFRISMNAPFRLGPNIQRAPDICLVRTSSFLAMEVVRGVLQGAPDLAVEVVSKNDTAVDIDRKVEQYLRAGTEAVWLLYSETRHLIVHRRSGEVRKYEGGQTLEEPDVLPGLAIPVDEFFSGV